MEIEEFVSDDYIEHSVVENVWVPQDGVPEPRDVDYEVDEDSIQRKDGSEVPSDTREGLKEVMEAALLKEAYDRERASNDRFLAEYEDELEEVCGGRHIALYNGDLVGVEPVEGDFVEWSDAVKEVYGEELNTGGALAFEYVEDGAVQVLSPFRIGD